jgi:hypothetical protein
VALVDGRAPCIGVPLAGLEKQSPHLRMNQAHPHGHREALGEAEQTVRLADREQVARRIFQRCDARCMSWPDNASALFPAGQL